MTTDALETIARRYRGNADVFFDVVPLDTRERATLIFCPALCDIQLINRLLLPEIRKLYRQTRLGKPEDMDRASILLERLSDLAPSKTDAHLFGGEVLIGFPRLGAFYSFHAARFPERNTEESNIEVSIRGPKNGLVESIETNFGLLRRYMPVHTVSFETYEIGTKTATKVGLVFDSEKIGPGLLADIRERLNKIGDRIEELISASQLEEVISDTPFSLFPLTVYTGRPDFVTSCVLRGRFAIVIDGVPGAMIAPISLSMLLKTPEDAHFNFLSASFGQLLRLFSLLVAIFLPGFYIALTGYHQDQIPFPLLATIVTTRIGIPLSTPMEMVLVLTLLEMFKEAGYRLPAMIGQTLTVVGGLIIGDAAIRAGLISPSMVVVAAISTVAGSTLISQTLSGTVSILRYSSVFISATLGAYGFMLSVLFLLVYMTSLTSFGVSFLAPLAPISAKDIGRALLMYPRKLGAFVPGYLKKRS
ncbi:spore germination protein [Cohnella cellulosilytica]|uniref:Spore germination protein n=1 Tax=Cohnella cellulosilytica TaxID=986710 RepID=A0ABW2F1J7_9BACL